MSATAAAAPPNLLPPSTICILPEKMKMRNLRRWKCMELKKSAVRQLQHEENVLLNLNSPKIKKVSLAQFWGRFV